MKQTEKLVFIVFLISLLFISTSIYAEFCGTAKISPSEIEVENGEEFSIDVGVVCEKTDGNRFVTSTLIKYDKDILEYKKAETSDGREIASELFEETGYIFTDGESEDLFTITFKAKNESTEIKKTKIIFTDFTVTDGGEDVVYTDLGTKEVEVTIFGIEKEDDNNSVGNTNNTENNSNENLIENENTTNTENNSSGNLIENENTTNTENNSNENLIENENTTNTENNNNENLIESDNNNNTNTIEKVNIIKKSNKVKKDMPVTGENHSLGSMIISLLILIAIAIGVELKRRSLLS